MATLTPLVPNGTVSNTNINQWTGGTAAWVDGGLGGGGFGDIDDTVGSIATTGESAAGPALNHNTSNELLIVDVTAVDTDFASMDTIALHYDSAIPGTIADDDTSLECRITASDGTTEYVTWTTLRSFNGTTGVWDSNGPPAANTTKSLTLTGTGSSASQSNWNGARLHFRFTSVKTKGNDGATPVLVVDARLTGTYTQAAAATSNRPPHRLIRSPHLIGR